MPGQNNPTGIPIKSGKDAVPFTPYATIKDIFAVVVFLIFFAYWVFYMPNYLGHADNYIPANPAVTPSHIVPEWYFLPFYAILRAIPDKLGGVIAMVAAIAVLVLHALARHLEGALHGLSPALQAVLLGLRGRLRRARLARLAARPRAGT